MNDGLERGAAGNSAEQEVIEAYAFLACVSPKVAADVQAFRLRVIGAVDEVRAALGDRCGDIWCDWQSPADIRLKIAVASSGFPPAGAHVQAAKRILRRTGLLDATDFLETAISSIDVLNDLARVSAALGDSGAFARAVLRSDPIPGRLHSGNVWSSLWIETVRGLTPEQQAIVEYAASVARGPVQVQPCLGAWVGVRARAGVRRRVGAGRGR